MDPLTHALLGGAAAYAVVGHSAGRRAALVGAVAALLPDADVLVRSAADPLLAIEHHRGFTHSLAFAPVGGAIAALPWLARRGTAPLPILAAAIVGYATHGPLDAATTYGTQLFWPFSRYRVALDWISILDPLFTLLLAIGLLLALRRRSPTPVVAALALALLYLGFGAAQRERALAAQHRLAAARGDQPLRRAAFPTIGNRIVWRSLYLAGDSLHMDRVRVPLGGDPTYAAAGTHPLLREEALAAAKRRDPRVLRDFRRFVWFCDGWVARAPGDSSFIGDARYSLVDLGYSPVWGIRLDSADPVSTTRWIDRSRERRGQLRALLRAAAGRDPAYRPIP